MKLLKQIKNTLQSIDNTLKRIEVILLNFQKKEIEKPFPLEVVQDALSKTPVYPMKLVQELSEHSKQSGYGKIKSILSDWVVIQFSVPCHEWNELETSKEWKNFQDLLEKHQTE